MKAQGIELATHDRLTEVARRAFADQSEAAGIEVVSVTDPEPSKGYLLIIVLSGYTRCHRLGDTIKEALDTLRSPDVILNEMG
jgi:hypothetical protein